ncbi:hypothetical protein NFX46_17690 [Streptomyces phaeoluteigriseus]|uniref:NAD(+)--protein-arginine ADP-ribosyltransferase n=1 Tax=Streptomyces phaeoluteigriseus TaxID=114686 RepID=A0ABY4Z8T4_9ACTN|nr:hypothetical protein [Streptomyces phaeoluteigriseus]USQ85448.1 hypothetical protein NFX46_17690 [Streptomyces phaeoluteigriseus]
MSRWSSVMPGRGRRSDSGTGRRGRGLPAGDASGAESLGSGGPPVEDVDGVLLVRAVDDDSFPLDVVAEVAGAVGREAGVVTVMVGSAAEGGAPDAGHWARLGALLDSLRARGTDRVRLVMSGAGDDRPDRPCVARRIADAWELEVTAPDGAVLITPGGALFVHGGSRPGGGWWRFAPGTKPRRLGLRAPAPAWEEALGAVPERTAGGCVVDRVPAGVVIRPAEAPGPAPDDLSFSVPVDFERLTVLVGAPQAEDVAAEEVAAVLAGLPEAQRARARLAPGGRRDLLRLAQSVADLLATEVEVLTGLPLLDDHAPPGTPPRPTLVGLDGRPSWRPFVSAVVCGPVDSKGRAPAPRPTELHSPDWILGGSERGTVRLTDRWQATVTRAGLALWALDVPRPGPLGPAVDPEACVIELGMPGQPLDDSLLPALSRLLHGLGTDVRSRTTLLVRGRLLASDSALRRLAAEHGVPNIRYVTTGRPPRPGTASARPRATAQPGRVSPSGRMSHESGPAGALPTAGPGLPARAPAARPGAPEGGGAAEAIGVAGDPAVAELVAPADPRADEGAPGRPVAGAEGSVPPVSLREGGPVTAPESSPAGGPAEVDVDAVGPARAVGTPPGSPPETAEPGEAEAGAVMPTASSQLRPQGRPTEGSAPGASPETVPRTVAGVGSRQGASVPKVSPDGGAGQGAARARSAVVSSDVMRTVAEGERGIGGERAEGERGGDERGKGERVDGERGKGEGAKGERPDGGVGETGRAAGEGAGPGPDGDRAGRDGDRANMDGNRAGPDGDMADPDGNRAGPDGDRAVRAEPGQTPQVRGVEAPAPHRAALPFVPGHISGAVERAAFRNAAAGSWEGHAAAVSRVLTRMPALRGHELEAARTDLVAAHAYLTAEEGPLHHRELTRDLHTGEGRLLPYAGCLASALRRLPSYRGVALRGGNAEGPDPVIGTLLHDPAPVSALAGSSALPAAGAPARYAIWSVTGRKVRQLLDRPGGSTETYEEIVFVPGTGFRVVGVRTVPSGPSVVLLRELPGNATAYMDGSQELSGLDLKALAHLEEALAKGFRVGDDPRWPDRCSGPVGQEG